MFNYTIYEIITLPASLILILLTCFILKRALKNCNETIKDIPLKLIALIVVILEIIKQIENVITGFDAWALPFHYCSLFVFFFPLAEFTKGKLRKIFKPVAVITALTMALVFYLEPRGILGSSSERIFTDWKAFHSFTFHQLAIAYPLISISLNRYIPSKNDYTSLILVMVVYVLTILPLSYIINVNYCNFLFSVLGFLESLRIALGQVIYSIIIIIGIVGGPTLVCVLYRLIYNKINKI